MIDWNSCGSHHFESQTCMNFNQLQSEFWKESGKESAVDTSLYLNARNDRNPKSKNLFIHKQKKYIL